MTPEQLQRRGLAIVIGTLSAVLACVLLLAWLAEEMQR